jgi:energy-coupling factor transporter ATP-binding protein EcfA2
LKLLYVIGEPGVGKTTLVRAVTQLPCEVQTKPYISWTHYTDKACQLGYDRKPFGGTDALGMAAQNHVLAWLNTKPYRYILGEGDRLANMKFLKAVEEIGYDVTLAVLTCSPELLERRRAKRNAQLDKKQDEKWLKTRTTKVTNLRNMFEGEVWELDSGKPFKELAREFATHPVVRAIRKAKNAGV